MRRQTELPCATMRILKTLLLCVTLPLVSACDDGRITLSVTDAPIDEATEVIVQFSRVAFEREDGTREVVVLDQPRRIDLRSLTGGASEVLVAEQNLPAGRYRAVEFTVDGSSTTLESSVLLADGRRLSLFVPDASRSSLRVTADFVIAEQQRVDATVDFDLRRSLFIVDDTRAELRPQLRFVLDDEVGTARGQIAASLVTPPCSAAIYVYEGFDAEPDDVGGSGKQPLSSTIVDFTPSTGEYSYAVGFLKAGRYTLALTCEASADDPGRNDNITFKRLRNVTIRERRTATENFQ
jgi:hypothetical protein